MSAPACSLSPVGGLPVASPFTWSTVSDSTWQSGGSAVLGVRTVLHSSCTCFHYPCAGGVGAALPLRTARAGHGGAAIVYGGRCPVTSTNPRLLLSVLPVFGVWTVDSPMEGGRP